jgi:hypothetical protein
MTAQARCRDNAAMPAGLTALALLAQAASASTSYGPAAPAPAKKPVSTVPADDCEARQTDPRNKEILICAPRIDGYRLNPDVLEARREMRSGGRPTRPGPDLRPYRDCNVGPMGCQQAGINLIGAALTAVEMAKRVSEGKEIGSMFVTDPQPSEYQLYLAAKARREAEEAQKAAAAATARAKEKAAAKAISNPAPAAAEAKPN